MISGSTTDDSGERALGFNAPTTEAMLGQRKIVIADLDRDGALDLAVVNPGDGTVSILRGACR